MSSNRIPMKWETLTLYNGDNPTLIIDLKTGRKIAMSFDSEPHFKDFLWRLVQLAKALESSAEQMESELRRLERRTAAGA